MLILSEHAKNDLIDIWSYIALDNIDAADRFIERIYNLCETISKNPEMGRERNELSPNLRSFPIKRYVVYYRIQNKNTEVIRVLSGYRDISSIF